MLSIDITDRQIKLAKGVLSGGKIHVDDVDTRDVPEGSIVNGYITDIPVVSGEIIDLLTSKGISEKEIIVCINSSSILYKELDIARPKALKNHSAIEAMVVAQMGVTTDYNVTYSILKEYTEEDGEKKLKLMANACPSKMVEGYERLFSQLGLKAKHLNLSNNCIMRLVLNSELRVISPLLCVQVESDSVNMNLFEDGILSFSRYVKVDMTEYSDNPDFINVAVFDNLFRTLQFIGQRKDSRPLKEILFYGTIDDFPALSSTISSFNIPSRLIETPENVDKNCDFEFSSYANAVGALNKFDPIMEHIDLHTSAVSRSKAGKNSAFFIKIGATALGCAVLVGGAYAVFKTINYGLRQNIAIVEGQIADKKLRYELLTKKVAVFDNFSLYKDSVEAARILIEFQPQDIEQVRQKIDEAVKAVSKDKEDKRAKGKLAVKDVKVDGYVVTGTFTCSTIELPSYFYRIIVNQGFFTNVTYTGYEQTPRAEGETLSSSEKYTFTLVMHLKGGHAFEVLEGGAKK